MQLHPIDWFFIIGYCVLAFGIGTYFAKRAGGSIDEFFIAGRNLPWWLAGTSIVATSFAADTPLAISGLIRSQGIYANWFWWNLVFGGMMCTFFYAHLWRRAKVLTDIEFIELRYEGRAASILRGFMAVYSGVLMNCIVIGWVLLAMTKICDVTLGWDKHISISILVLIALAYTVLSGFWGVVMTDLIQFIMAMTGSIALAAIILYKMGGPTGMVEQVMKTPDFTPKVFDFIPDLKTAGKLAVFTFAIQLSFQWWPKGQGDGYLAQRLFSTKNERHSVLASLWFNFANYVIRPWPWIIVGIASFVYFSSADLPKLENGNPDYERAYPMMMMKFMPPGLLGLMVASLLAAFMSTIDTQLNWGASYLVNDLYKRFIRPDETEKHYVLVSRIAVVLLMGIASLVTWQLQTIEGAWMYHVVILSGSGLVLLLRWYWWRVNPWSEISALTGAFIIANGKFVAGLFQTFGLVNNDQMMKIEWFYSKEAYAVRLVTIVIVCTIVWVAVTFLTKPVSSKHLEKFYRRVRPGGWWKPIAARCPEIECESGRSGWIGWLFGVVCIYSGLFGLGHICLGRYMYGIIFLFISSMSGWLSITRVPKDINEHE